MTLSKDLYDIHSACAVVFKHVFKSITWVLESPPLLSSFVIQIYSIHRPSLHETAIILVLDYTGSGNRTHRDKPSRLDCMEVVLRKILIGGADSNGDRHTVKVIGGDRLA